MNETEELRALREGLQALADEHEAWMGERVPANDLDERDQHRGFVYDVRALLASSGQPA